jgi:hypothetical protein
MVATGRESTTDDWEGQDAVSVSGWSVQTSQHKSHEDGILNQCVSSTHLRCPSSRYRGRFSQGQVSCGRSGPSPQTVAILLPHTSASNMRDSASFARLSACDTRSRSCASSLLMRSIADVPEEPRLWGQRFQKRGVA